jgi:glycosyltransferase involved in cell wall biosynthesis
MVRDNLVDNHGVSPGRIEQIPAFVARSAPITRDPGAIRRALGIPQDAYIVGGCGKLGFRKGTDLFLAVAKRVTSMSPQPIHFVWVGGGMELESIQFQLDVAKLGLQELVHFPGPTSEPQDYFNTFELFLMTSREEPFGLVCLENGRVGNPILCFDEAVGSSEFIDESCGHISPYMDVDDMATAVTEFVTDRDRRERASRIIRERVSPYTVEECAPKILGVINDVMRFAEA